MAAALGAGDTAAQSADASDAGPIQDNSFFLEEAYNQESRVVQHISAFERPEGGDGSFTFTQEWPAFGQKHQLSVTLPFQRDGVGDVAINYRYQLIGSGEERIAFAPRLSLLLPSGNEEKENGSGATGVQVNLPLSTVLGPALVAHWNAGATYVPSARNAEGDEADAGSFNLGGSVIWLARPTLNFLLEAVWESVEEVVGPGRTDRTRSAFLVPGVRWAHNFKSGLQIVPGIGVPIGIGSSAGEHAIFLYLSFEHPY
jgi:hypothetical protein